MCCENAENILNMHFIPNEYQAQFLQVQKRNIPNLVRQFRDQIP